MRITGPVVACVVASGPLALFVGCASDGDAARPRPSLAPITAAAAERSDPVQLELEEVRVVFHDDGTVTREVHDVYRVLVPEPGTMWSQVFAGWQPWTDDAPQLDATVVRPDGTTTRLDGATVTDQPAPRDDGLITDSKLRLAPLPGLSVGAVVERRVTTRHRPQLVKGHADAIGLGPTLPVKRQHFVVEAPAGLTLHSRVLRSDAQVKREERDGKVILTIERRDVPLEPDPEPMGRRDDAMWGVWRFSTVPSWQDAARAWSARAEQQLAAPAEQQAVQKLAKEITAGKSTRDQKVQAVLSWLNRHVRYTGLELGESAWVPFRPTEVIERQYGDCKDMSLLLVALLRAAGVNADIALVRSVGAVDIDTDVPGLSFFDHAIVRLGDAPHLWFDATQPLLGYGEVSAALIGRLALLARQDSSAPVVVETAGVSALELKVETVLADFGRARFVRERSSDGLLYSSGRDLAGHSLDEYKKNLERWAKENHHAAQPVQIEASDPRTIGWFRERLVIPDSAVGTTGGTTASALFITDQAFAPLTDLRGLDRAALRARGTPISLPMPVKVTVHNRVVPPAGYRAEELPDPVEQRVSGAQVTLRWKRDGDALEGTLTFEHGRLLMTGKEAADLCDLIDSVDNIRVEFKSAVFDAIGKARYFTGVREAENLVKASAATAVDRARRRALLAYALTSAGLTDLAQQEATAALKEAPDDALVRNRAAHTWMHNNHGVEFGAGFSRARVLEIVRGTVKRHPDDEWAHRLLLLTLLRGERGGYFGPGVELTGVADQILDYRKRFDSTALDDELIHVLVRERDWTRVMEHADTLEAAERNAAWLAADAVKNGGERALKKAIAEQRFSDELLATTLTVLMVSQEYDAAVKLTRAAARQNGREQQVEPFVALVQKMKPCIPEAGTPVATLRRMFHGVISEDDAALDRAFTRPLTKEERVEVRGELDQFLRDSPLRGANLDPFMCDALGVMFAIKREPIGDLGELVTMEPTLPGTGNPFSLWMQPSKDGPRIAIDAEPLLAWNALLAQERSDQERSTALLRALHKVRKDRHIQQAIEAGEWSSTVTLWAATIVANQSKPRREALLPLLHKRLAGLGVTGMQAALLVDAFDDALEDAPEQRIAVARQLGAHPDASVGRMATRMEVRALRELSRFKEADALIGDALKKTPEDPLLLSLQSSVAADLGDFSRARQLATARATALEGKAAGSFLNNAAWYSIFEKPDELARQQAEQAVQLDGVGSRFNTLAAVYAGLEDWDQTANAMRRHQAVQAFSDDDEPHVSYWYVRGRLVEALGRKDAAQAAYKKVTRAKNKSADDAALLAEQRLKALAR